MALIGQNQQTSFANPQNGQAPDADVIRNNDNALVAKHNAHDADATIHVQTGTLASRPAAGTAGAVYIDENKRIYVDNGSVWGEVPYARLDAAGTNAFANNVSIGGTLTVTTGLTDVMDVDAADVVADTVTAGAFSGSGAGLTSIPQSAITNLTTDLAGKAATSHAHAASAITSGTLDAARLPSTMTTSAFDNKTFQGNVVVGGVVQGSSASFSSSAEPLAFAPLSSGSGSLLTLNANASSGWTVISSGSVPAMSGQGPGTASTGWRWIRINVNGSDHFIPALY